MLKVLLALYVLLGITLAGLNNGYAPRADAAAQALIAGFWHFYENGFKTLLMVAASLLSLRLVRRAGATKQRRQNLFGFILAALVVHVFGPELLRNPQLHFFYMPAPWSTTAWQVMDESSPFHAAITPVWGVAGMAAVLLFFAAVNLVVLVGTLLVGRRWQCSMLCLFNGFAAEIFAPVFPLLGRTTKPGPKMRGIFSLLRWLMLGLALFYTLYWLLRSQGIALVPKRLDGFVMALEIWKFLLLELLMMMFCWVALGGRGYCYYCPLGTVLSFLGRAAGQRLETGVTACVQCGKCDQACPMGLAIQVAAKTGAPVTDPRCVGCGHCVDLCPAGTLEYTTCFLKRMKTRRKKSCTP